MIMYSMTITRVTNMGEPTHDSMDDRRVHDADLHERVAFILDLIRPAVQDDGGDVELVEVTDSGIVSVRFHGACVGCPSSSLTLQSGIERTLKDRIPEVTEVRQVS